MKKHMRGNRIHDEAERGYMIVKAALEDARIVAELAIKMWGEHTIDELTKDFEGIIENAESALFVLYIEGQATGFAQCQLRHDYVEGTSSSPVGYLEGIFIEEEYRYNGYAKKLLTKCEEWAKEMGCTEFASDCEIDNSKSLAFHLKMGFAEANRIICFTKSL